MSQSTYAHIMVYGMFSAIIMGALLMVWYALRTISPVLYSIIEEWRENNRAMDRTMAQYHNNHRNRKGLS